jgi:predicted dehydrogenase
MERRIIRWGIMGAGRIAHKFAADLSLVDNARLVAVGSRSKEKAKAFAGAFNIPRACGTYESFLEDEELDVVYIATPHSHHYENTLMCLDKGKGVLCEKAFAVNAKQAAEMISKAREKRLFLMEALWTKFLPHYRKLKEMLSENVTGGVDSVLVDFGFRPPDPVPQRLFDPALAGGTMLDIGIYNVFMAMSVLGRPDEIHAHMTPSASGVDEQAAVLFRYNNGAMAQLFSSFTTHLPTEAEISGPQGRIKLNHRFYAPECTIDFFPGRPETRQPVLFNSEKTGFGYQHEARHVVECLQQGLLESPVMSHKDTFELMQVLDEIREKAGIRYEQLESR